MIFLISHKIFWRLWHCYQSLENLSPLRWNLIRLLNLRKISLTPVFVKWKSLVQMQNWMNASECTVIYAYRKILFRARDHQFDRSPRAARNRAFQRHEAYAQPPRQPFRRPEWALLCVLLLYYILYTIHIRILVHRYSYNTVNYVHYSRFNK